MTPSAWKEYSLLRQKRFSVPPPDAFGDEDSCAADGVCGWEAADSYHPIGNREILALHDGCAVDALGLRLQCLTGCGYVRALEGLL